MIKIILLFLLSACYVFGDACVDGTVEQLQPGLRMKCENGKWIPVEKKAARAPGQPGAPPCQDDPAFSANGTCAADRPECLQYSEKGVTMDKDCPGTCGSCDACRCQDHSQWHPYCSYWAKYCSTPGILGNWMTTNCRKTCQKCSCKCCSYQGEQHSLGAEILLPEKCGKLVCQEFLVAGPSPLLSGAARHPISHPEELTLDFIMVHDGADCCILPADAVSDNGTRLNNGTMVQEGWNGRLLRNGQSIPISCCHGVLSVPLDGVTFPLSTGTTTPKFITLPYCKIEALSFALDISGSMNGATMDIWKPVADQLVDEMVRRRVSIDRYYLFTYVNTINPAQTTQDPQDFRNTIANWSSFSGATELTYTALKHAMEQVNSNAFVCVWTDEIGDDTNDASLKADILSLKASTNSEIFFMAVTQATSARKVRDTSEEDGSKGRASLTIGNFEQKFNDIGHVLDITNDPNVVSKMITIMQQTAICNPSTTAV